MSIEAIRSRISEIESKIQSLSYSPDKPKVQSDLKTVPMKVPAPTGQINASIPLAPFSVELGKVKEAKYPRLTGTRTASEIDGLINRYSYKFGLDASLVKAVIKVESDGNPESVSSRGAMGLMQLMPCDCEQYNVTDPFDPDQNIRAGVNQLADKLKMFGGNLDLALAAYNAGAGKVKRAGGIPNNPETRNYVSRVHQEMARLR